MVHFVQKYSLGNSLVLFLQFFVAFQHARAFVVRLCLYTLYYHLLLSVSQVQEFRTGATRQNMETIHSKEESKRLRQQLQDLRDKLADLDARVVHLIISCHS